jgi:ParB family chromosome partitioning protein
MTQQRLAAAPSLQTRVQVRLCDLGLAPENLRSDEPEDADVPRLAETIRAAGLIYPPVVRKGRRGEPAFLVLDGRRRRYALLRLAAEGAIPADHPVECLLSEDRASHAAAAVLPNAEHAPVHLADVIVGIGKLRRSRLTTAAIAEALGYDETEVKRLEAMAHVHDDVLAAFRAGRLSLRQVRLFARLKDKARQSELAQQALEGYFQEYTLRSLVTDERVTLEDPRFALVSEADYAAAGGRLHADLFGELPAEVLDPEILDQAWRTAAGKLVEPLAEAGLSVSFARERGFAAPAGLERLPFVHWGSLPEERRASFDAAREVLEGAVAAVGSASAEARSSAIAEVVTARLAMARLIAGRAEVVAALVTPLSEGVDVTFFQRPAPEPARDEADEATDEDEGDQHAETDEDLDGGVVARRGRSREDIEAPRLELDVAGVSHAQHAARTLMATRGLIRDLADAPLAALIVLTAHLFAEIALKGPRGADEAVLRIRAVTRRGADAPSLGLDDEVFGRLEGWRRAYLASGLRPIGYVAGLDAEDRQRLLAELVAVTVDLREERTDRVRAAARAEAMEVAALCQANLSARWTPDADFLALHSRTQLLTFLAEMDAQPEKAAALKKPELVQAALEAAAARRWTPACLAWPHQVLAAPDDGAQIAGQQGEEQMHGEDQLREQQHEEGEQVEDRAPSGDLQPGFDQAA